MEDNREVFRIVTRCAALLCLLCGIGELAMLSVDSLGVMHHYHRLQEAKAVGQFISEEAYWLRYYLGFVAAHLLGAAIAAALALWLYRGGNRIRKFLGVAD